MPRRPALHFLRILAHGCAAGALGLAGLLAHAAGPGAAALQARYAELGPALQRSPFGRPLLLDSTEAAGQLSGRVQAVVDHPFDTVSAALQAPQSWCEVLMLHLNVKQCQVRQGSAGPVLAVYLGRKHGQPLVQAQRVELAFASPTASADYLDLRLRAERGPLATSDYRISLQAVPLPGGKTFLAMDYSYAYGIAAQLAMKGYLATVGSGKRGFTTTGSAADGKPAYIGGVRAVVERNTMRYYLAIDAYLDSLAGSSLAQQREQRLAAWFDATERYAQQLHEIDRDEYLVMKRDEFRQLPAGR
ncbi:hypothetical protein AAFF27_19175 [Xylophilus sp. GW821-FHT01B05]